VAGVLVLAAAAAAVAQQAPAPGDMLADEPQVLSPAAEKFKQLADPEGKLKKKADDRNRPLYEFYRTQVAPFEVLPFVKENHWSTLTLEMRANFVDYVGRLQTSTIRLRGMPHDMVFRREARIPKEQPSRLAMQMMLPETLKEIGLDLVRADAFRPDGGTLAPLRRLEPHQMLVPILGPNAQGYVNWSRLRAMLPGSGDRDVNAVERQRYYRTVTTQDADKVVPLSPHPLTWTTISHILWDGLDPDALNLPQQQALVDWLHWGGQLVIVGGAGPSLAPLEESFLGPYLPARPSGKNVELSAADLEALVRAHPAPFAAPLEGETVPVQHFEAITEANRIVLPPNRKLFLSGLDPAPGATALPLGDPGENLLGVEWRVGRGRVLMLAIKPTDSALQSWPGFDTFVRRVILRRELEPITGPRYGILAGGSVTWLRYAARDLGVPIPPSLREGDRRNNFEVPLPTSPVAAWVDDATLPVLSRRALQEASGLRIPGSDFVLRVMLLYVAALVPLNWVLCRFVLRRRELAWVVTPLLALGFAVFVERGAAYDMGFDRACDEVDLVEIQGDYNRAHLSRFAALYSTGRVSFSVAVPDNPTALALPMNMANAVRGGDVAQSAWESYPEPALREFPVQPRALAMYRAEAMVNVGGGIRLLGTEGARVVANRSDLPLRDAVLVHVRSGTTYEVGTVPPGMAVRVGAARPGPRTSSAAAASPRSSRDDRAQPAAPTEPFRIGSGREGAEWLDPEPFLASLRDYRWERPEDRGEWRLVAWTPGPHGGQVFTPAVDRHRGFRLVLAHLEYDDLGPTPMPDMTEGGEPLASYRVPDPAAAPAPAPAAADDEANAPGSADRP
jgi:hypothetical protein